MPSVWQERFAQYLKHVLNLRESTELSVLPDLMPVLPVLDAAAPEFAWYRGEARFLSGYTVAAVAAQNGTFVIKVHDPGFIIIIDHASASGVAATYRFTLSAYDLPVVSPEVALDQRDSHPSKARARLMAGATAGVSNPHFAIFGSEVRLPAELPIVLGFGDYFAIQCDTVNQAFTARIAWRERSVAGTSEG